MSWRFYDDDDNDEFGEGCPDCGRDTIVDDCDLDCSVCVECGWRSE